MKNKFITFVGAAAVAVALVQTVQAVPITGNIGFSGAVELNSGSVQAATEAVTWFNTVVNGSSGSFAGIANGTSVAMADSWSFNSGALNSFWSVGGFTYNLISSSVSSQDGTFLNVVLAGTVSGNGFDTTAFTGTFQAANPPSDGFTTFTERLSFTSVPDGGTTVVLLGMTFIGMAFIKRKVALG